MGADYIDKWIYVSVIVLAILSNVHCQTVVKEINGTLIDLSGTWQEEYSDTESQSYLDLKNDITTRLVATFSNKDVDVLSVVLSNFREPNVTADVSISINTSLSDMDILNIILMGEQTYSLQLQNLAFFNITASTNNPAPSIMITESPQQTSSFIDNVETSSTWMTAGPSTVGSNQDQTAVDIQPTSIEKMTATNTPSSQAVNGREIPSTSEISQGSSSNFENQLVPATSSGLQTPSLVNSAKVTAMTLGEQETTTQTLEATSEIIVASSSEQPAADTTSSLVEQPLQTSYDVPQSSTPVLQQSSSSMDALKEETLSISAIVKSESQVTVVESSSQDLFRTSSKHVIASSTPVVVEKSSQEIMQSSSAPGSSQFTDQSSSQAVVESSPEEQAQSTSNPVIQSSPEAVQETTHTTMEHQTVPSFHMTTSIVNDLDQVELSATTSNQVMVQSSSVFHESDGPEPSSLTAVESSQLVDVIKISLLVSLQTSTPYSTTQVEMTTSSTPLPSESSDIYMLSSSVNPETSSEVVIVGGKETSTVYELLSTSLVKSSIEMLTGTSSSITDAGISSSEVQKEPSTTYTEESSTHISDGSSSVFTEYLSHSSSSMLNAEISAPMQSEVLASDYFKSTELAQITSLTLRSSSSVNVEVYPSQSSSIEFTSPYIPSAKYMEMTSSMSSATMIPTIETETKVMETMSLLEQGTLSTDSVLEGSPSVSVIREPSSVVAIIPAKSSEMELSQSTKSTEQFTSINMSPSVAASEEVAKSSEIELSQSTEATEQLTLINMSPSVAASVEVVNSYSTSMYQPMVSMSVSSFYEILMSSSSIMAAEPQSSASGMVLFSDSVMTSPSTAISHTVEVSSLSLDLTPSLIEETTSTISIIHSYSTSTLEQLSHSAEATSSSSEVALPKPDQSSLSILMSEASDMSTMPHLGSSTEMIMPPEASSSSTLEEIPDSSSTNILFPIVSSSSSMDEVLVMTSSFGVIDTSTDELSLHVSSSSTILPIIPQSTEIVSYSTDLPLSPLSTSIVSTSEMVSDIRSSDSTSQMPELSHIMSSSQMETSLSIMDFSSSSTLPVLPSLDLSEPQSVSSAPFISSEMETSAYSILSSGSFMSSEMVSPSSSMNVILPSQIKSSSEVVSSEMVTSSSMDVMLPSILTSSPIEMVLSSMSSSLSSESVVSSEMVTPSSSIYVILPTQITSSSEMESREMITSSSMGVMLPSILTFSPIETILSLTSSGLSSVSFMSSEMISSSPSMIVILPTDMVSSKMVPSSSLGVVLSSLLTSSPIEMISSSGVMSEMSTSESFESSFVSELLPVLSSSVDSSYLITSSDLMESDKISTSPMVYSSFGMTTSLPFITLPDVTTSSEMMTSSALIMIPSSEISISMMVSSDILTSSSMYSSSVMIPSMSISSVGVITSSSQMVSEEMSTLSMVYSSFEMITTSSSVPLPEITMSSEMITSSSLIMIPSSGIPSSEMAASSSTAMIPSSETATSSSIIPSYGMTTASSDMISSTLMPSSGIVSLSSEVVSSLEMMTSSILASSPLMETSSEIMTTSMLVSSSYSPLSVIQTSTMPSSSLEIVASSVSLSSTIIMASSVGATSSSEIAASSSIMATSSSTIVSSEITPSSSSSMIVTSSLVITSPRPIVTVEIDGRFRITNGTIWSDALNNKTTAEYITLKNDLKTKLEEMFKNSDLKDTFKNINDDVTFSEGSVIVDYSATFQGFDTVSPNAVTKVFKDSIASNNNLLGTYTIDEQTIEHQEKGSITTTTTPAPGGVTPKSQLLPHWAIAVIVCGGVLLLFLLFMMCVLCSRRHTRQKYRMPEDPDDIGYRRSWASSNSGSGEFTYENKLEISDSLDNNRKQPLAENAEIALNDSSPRHAALDSNSNGKSGGKVNGNIIGNGKTTLFDIEQESWETHL